MNIEQHNSITVRVRAVPFSSRAGAECRRSVAACALRLASSPAAAPSGAPAAGQSPDRAAWTQNSHQVRQPLARAVRTPHSGQVRPGYINNGYAEVQMMTVMTMLTRRYTKF